MTLWKKISLSFYWALIPCAIWTFLPLIFTGSIAPDDGLTAMLASWASLFCAYDRMVSA